MTAISRYTITIRSMIERAPLLSRLPSAIGVVPMLALRWVISGTRLIAAAPPTIATLARTLPSSKPTRLPKICLAPCIGLSFLKLGLSR